MQWTARSLYICVCVYVQIYIHIYIYMRKILKKKHYACVRYIYMHTHTHTHTKIVGRGIHAHVLYTYIYTHTHIYVYTDRIKRQLIYIDRQTENINIYNRGKYKKTQTLACTLISRKIVSGIFKSFSHTHIYTYTLNMHKKATHYIHQINSDIFNSRDQQSYINNACDNSIFRISCVLKESLMLLLGKYKLEVPMREQLALLHCLLALYT